MNPAPRTTPKLLSLLAYAVLSVAAFRLEMALCGLNRWRTGIMEARACFYAIPALFALWLSAFCRVRAAWWRWAAFAASYALWFVLSYIFYGCLIEFFLGSVGFLFKHFGGICFFFLKAFAIVENESVQERVWAIMIYATLAVCALGVYALFVLENVAVKKLFRLSFKKPDWILLFCYPAPLAAFSLPVTAAYALANGGHFGWLCEIDTYFYSGAVIFGHVLTEGLLFIRGTKGK